MPRITITSLTNELASLKAEKDVKIGELENEKVALNNKIAELTNQFEQAKNDFENNKQQIIKEKDNILLTKEAEWKATTDQSNQEIKKLKSDLEQKQKELNSKELKKLAQAYKDQESNHEAQAKKWFKYVWVNFAVVVLGTALIIHYTHSVTWSEKIGYYLVDIVLITSLVFTLKQYSYYVKLSTDYANRKTLAQSYQNILNSEEDVNIKSKFLEKATEVLTSPAEVTEESYTIPEKILESVTEIAKNLSQK